MDQEEVEQLRAQVAEMDMAIRAQYEQLQQIQQRLHQLDPNGAAQPLKQPASFSLENFIGLRLIHLVGIVVLVIGVSIGVKYAFDKQLISEAARILLAYAAGAVLLLFSLRLKEKYPAFSAILFSGAMATVYFTSYAAHVYYNIFSFSAAFGFMVLLTIFTAMQAVRYNRSEIALLGLVGAYGIPFLISRNADKAELLFLYIGIINGGVLYLMFKKAWPQMGRLALLLTWILFIGWVNTRFRSGQEKTAVLFLVFFFFLFLGMLAGPYIKQPFKPHVVHALFINTIAPFIAALAVFAPAYQSAPMAAVSLIFAAVAAVQGLAAQNFLHQNRYLQQVMYLLAVGLVVIAIALRFDGLSVTILWLLLSIGLFGLGAWLRDKTWRLAALGLMALTLLKLLVLDSLRFSAGQKVAAYLALGLLLLVVSFFYQKFREKWFGE
jgi:uncharacterized membrane protein